MQEQIDSFLDHLMVQLGYSQNTLAAYRNDLGQFADHLASAGRQRWTEVGESTIAGYLLQLRDKEYSSSTVARKTAPWGCAASRRRTSPWASPPRWRACSRRAAS